MHAHTHEGCVRLLTPSRIAGVYGTLPTLPGFAGNEGVAVVEEVGSGVKGVQKGQRVIPAKVCVVARSVLY